MLISRGWKKTASSLTISKLCFKTMLRFNFFWIHFRSFHHLIESHYSMTFFCSVIYFLSFLQFLWCPALGNHNLLLNTPWLNWVIRCYYGGKITTAHLNCRFISFELRVSFLCLFVWYFVEIYGIVINFKVFLDLYACFLCFGILICSLYQKLL